MLAVSEVSASEIAAESFLPRLARICLAEERICLPSGLASLIEDSGRDAVPFSKSSGVRRQFTAQRVAARISGGRIRPSLSASIISSVLRSNSTPLVGQAKATQSF